MLRTLALQPAFSPSFHCAPRTVRFYYLLSLRLRELDWLVQSHTARRWQSCFGTQEIQNPKPHGFQPTLHCFFLHSLKAFLVLLAIKVIHSCVGYKEFKSFLAYFHVTIISISCKPFQKHWFCGICGRMCTF